MYVSLIPTWHFFRQHFLNWFSDGFKWFPFLDADLQLSGITRKITEQCIRGNIKAMLCDYIFLPTVMVPSMLKGI